MSEIVQKNKKFDLIIWGANQGYLVCEYIFKK